MYLEQNGLYRTDSLFVERIAKRHKNAGLKPVYHLSERKESNTTEKLYDVFINSTDEYDFAIKAFGSKAHLDKLKEISWFLYGWPGAKTFRGYNEWLADMDARDQSIGKKILMEKAQDGDVPAAKKLMDMHKSVHTKGRPKKEDIRKEAVKKADEQAEVEEDMKRLNVIKLRG